MNIAISIIGLSLGAIIVFLGITKKFHPIIEDTVGEQQAQIVFVTFGIVIMMIFAAILISGY